MDNNTRMVFSDFNLVERVTADLVEKYRGIVLDEILEIWQEYGFGDCLNGYLKVINPDEYLPFLKEVYSCTPDEIPVFATGMGDIINCNGNGYLEWLNFRYNECSMIGKKFSLTMRRFTTDDFLENTLKWLPYPEAVAKYGRPKYNECFGYNTLLSLGGSEKVENLSKVKLVEHIYLICQMQGILSF
ncbi:MAG TPA: DUF1851 domain-containing protein [Bacillota bacterium]|jgi:hypothetical protein|nr:DUF1851 domain-containing protein [Bacillota bacterium]HOL09089.1 DUF1851 domain-containing protein [Bacillota bacterium]HPO98033.1 DUF1851 domain-containing protein [Bacillota bacterium]